MNLKTIVFIVAGLALAATAYSGPQPTAAKTIKDCEALNTLPPAQKVQCHRCVTLSPPHMFLPGNPANQRCVPAK